MKATQGKPAQATTKDIGHCARGHDMRDLSCILYMYCMMPYTWVGSFCEYVAHIPQVWQRRVARETVREQICTVPGPWDLEHCDPVHLS